MSALERPVTKIDGQPVQRTDLEPPALPAAPVRVRPHRLMRAPLPLSAGLEDEPTVRVEATLGRGSTSTLSASRASSRACLW